ncbi:hypothetical protein [Sinorhizobium fredii]|uniref:hypothetical protein n=1 Tax=Rhizobium fredii TaxID=380 RepID=UPI003516D62C
MALLTAIDIVNAAFNRIGETPIESFDDDGESEQDASLIYEEVVGFNLGLQPSGFTFAREVRQLSKLSGATPLTGYTNVFDIPGPYSGLPIFLSDDVTDPDRRFTAFILTAGQVHSDADPLFAMVKFRPDPHRWTDTFRAATIAAIASRLAMSVASDRTTAEALRAEAYGTPSENFRGGMMRAALAEDGFANPPRRADVDNNPLTRAWRS